MTVEANKSGPVVMTRRAYFEHKGNRMVAIEVSSGAIEIYQVDRSDGIEMFKGYLTDSNIPGSVRAAATFYLYSRAPEFSRQVQLPLFAEAA